MPSADDLFILPDFNSTFTMSAGCSAVTSPKVLLSIVGWWVSYAYFISFIPIFVTTATQYSDDAWFFSLMAAIGIGSFSLGLIYMGGHQPVWIRWFALPHIFTMIYGFEAIYPAFCGSTLAGHHLAAIDLEFPEQAEIATPLWHRFYAVVHVVFFAVAAFLAFRPAANSNS